METNINLQVTNSSCTTVGAGVYIVNCCIVKPGPPRLLCPLRFTLALPRDPTTLQFEPQYTKQGALLKPRLKGDTSRPTLPGRLSFRVATRA